MRWFYKEKENRVKKIGQREAKMYWNDLEVNDQDKIELIKEREKAENTRQLMLVEQRHKFEQNQWMQQNMVMKSNIDIRTSSVQASNKANVQLIVAEEKIRLREAAKEREKQVYEELLLTETGEVQLITRNLTIQSQPRKLTNMSNPTLISLKHVSNLDEEVFCIKCIVDNSEKEVFLDRDMAGKASYLLKKFAAAGISFMLPSAEAKQVVIKLFCVLKQASNNEKLLADMEGWMKKPDNTFEYVGEGELTWERARAMCK